LVVVELIGSFLFDGIVFLVFEEMCKG